MLVLSRKTEEAIVIGENITVTVLGVEGDRVRLGIDAPRSMRIFRRELLAQTRELNQEATQAVANTLALSQLTQQAEK